jgi:hypothetical protein
MLNSANKNIRVPESEYWTLIYQRGDGTPIWAVGEESSGVMRYVYGLLVNKNQTKVGHYSKYRNHHNYS